VIGWSLGACRRSSAGRWSCQSPCVRGPTARSANRPSRCIVLAVRRSVSCVRRAEGDGARHGDDCPLRGGVGVERTEPQATVRSLVLAVRRSVSGVRRDEGDGARHRW
jgi:hypothetical protein